MCDAMTGGCFGFLKGIIMQLDDNCWETKPFHLIATTQRGRGRGRGGCGYVILCCKYPLCQSMSFKTSCEDLLPGEVGWEQIFLTLQRAQTR